VSVPWRLERHAHLPSTQTALLARAEAGEAAGLVILADRQSSGRGRADRAWHSPPGNLHVSILLRPTGPGRELPQWSLLAGVALAEAAEPLAAGHLALKWPNDLLRDGAKCAGILADAALSPDGRIAWVALGIGVNLAHAPTLPERPTVTVGRAMPPAAFLGRLLDRLGAWQASVAAVGFGPLRARWMELGPGLGDRLALRDGPAGARYLGLAEDGALLVEFAGARRAVHAGEVLSAGER